MSKASGPTARHRRWLTALMLLSGSGCAASAPPAVQPELTPPARVEQVDVPRIPVERYTLANGLTVLLSPDRSAPVVAVNIWYNVGSRNEKPGRTGFAHLFEHVMFEGTEHIPEGTHPRLIEEAGGDLNGSTSVDRTVFYDVVPVSELETVLWLESDRMGFLLPALTQAKLDGQRDVVKNERREHFEQPPFGTENHILSAAIYPQGHPYSWPTIGSMADLSAASLEDVKDFFRRYYGPNNATLAIVGDIDLVVTRQLVEKYFGGIPAGPPVERADVRPVTLAAEKRLVLEDAKSRVPKLTIVWPTVGTDNPDSRALRALSQLLTGDRNSRLSRALVYDHQLATSVMAYSGNDAKAGEFYISVSPRSNASLTEIERVIDSVVASVTTAPPTDREVQHFRNYTAVNAVTSLQSVLGKSETLNEGQTFSGDPLHYITETRATLVVTPADVHRVAKQYLGAGRVVLSMVPAGKTDLAARPDRPFVNVTPSVVP
jgi:zinc protease